jgi:flagellar motor switch protein FliM
VTRGELDLARALGAPTDGEALLRGIAGEISRDLGAPVALRLERVGPASPSPLPNPGCVAAIDLPPLEGRVLADLDLGLALSAADRLLGGAGARPPILRPATPVERGALSYLLLRALARLDAGWMRDAGIRPRLAGFVEAATLAVGGVEARLAVRLGDDDGTLRLLFPPSVASSPVLRAERRGRLPGPLAGLAVEIGVEVARTSLAASELGTLAPRDVVLFDAPFGAGAARLRAAGGRGALEARAAQRNRGFELTIVAHRHEGGDTMSQPRPDGEHLLAEAQIPVWVELGRLTLRAEEIASLRAGDTLLLAKPPGAPVDLVAGGKVLARGELVDVEGELGFRVLSLGA